MNSFWSVNILFVLVAHLGSAEQKLKKREPVSAPLEFGYPWRPYSELPGIKSKESQKILAALNAAETQETESLDNFNETTNNYDYYDNEYDYDLPGENSTINQSNLEANSSIVEQDSDNRSNINRQSIETDYETDTGTNLNFNSEENKNDPNAITNDQTKIDNEKDEDTQNAAIKRKVEVEDTQNAGIKRKVKVEDTQNKRMKRKRKVDNDDSPMRPMSALLTAETFKRIARSLEKLPETLPDAIATAADVVHDLMYRSIRSYLPASLGGYDEEQNEKRRENMQSMIRYWRRTRGRERDYYSELKREAEEFFGVEPKPEYGRSVKIGNWSNFKM